MKIVLLIILLPFVFAAGANAAKTNASCSISPNPVGVEQTYIVSATGLPINVPINLYVTDPNGTTTGSPLGGTGDGTFNLEESSSFAGVWTYKFTGIHKRVAYPNSYATCTVSVA
jgi:hypothetical protein